MDVQLLSAIKSGNVDEARRLVVSERVDQHACDKSGRTSLLLAAMYGHVSVAQFLVEEGQVDVDKKNKQGYTALHAACTWDKVAVVKYLVETGGADVEARTHSGRTPLHSASWRGCRNTVRYLVEQQQAKVNSKDKDGHTPFDLAVWYTDRENVIRYLLPITSSVAKRTLMVLWFREKFADVRRMVLEKYALGRDLTNLFRRYPIHTVLLEFPFESPSDFQGVIEFLSPSSSLCSLDEQGRLPIHVSLMSQNPNVKSPSVVGYLLEREPKSALARDPTTGLFPHECAARNNSSNDCRWLDLVFKMFRSNPQELLVRRNLYSTRMCKKESESTRTRKRKRP